MSSFRARQSAAPQPCIPPSGEQPQALPCRSRQGCGLRRGGIRGRFRHRGGGRGESPSSISLPSEGFTLFDLAGVANRAWAAGEPRAGPGRQGQFHAEGSLGIGAGHGAGVVQSRPGAIALGLRMPANTPSPIRLRTSLRPRTCRAAAPPGPASPSPWAEHRFPFQAGQSPRKGGSGGSSPGASRSQRQ